VLRFFSIFRKSQRPQRRILLVDDEPVFTRLLKINLERTGRYIVREERDATKALEAASEFAPDLILLDVVMPKTDGNHVAAELRSTSRFCKTPIIFLTAVISNYGSSQRREIDGIPALAKPVGLEELVNAIEAAFQEELPVDQNEHPE
jgi:DNA-binding response OmpR family regulator